DDRGISGRIRVEWVAGSPWNRWSDAHGMGGQMTVESAVALSDELGVKKVLMAMQKKLYSKRSPCGGDLVMKKVTEVSVFKGCSDNITKKRSASFGTFCATRGHLGVSSGFFQCQQRHLNCL
ncbi:hypothetical protein, partial [Aquipseudomonas alcaligenes]